MIPSRRIHVVLCQSQPLQTVQGRICWFRSVIYYYLCSVSSLESHSSISIMLILVLFVLSVKIFNTNLLWKKKIKTFPFSNHHVLKTLLTKIFHLQGLLLPCVVTAVISSILKIQSQISWLLSKILICNFLLAME